VKTMNQPSAGSLNACIEGSQSISTNNCPEEWCEKTISIFFLKPFDFEGLAGVSAQPVGKSHNLHCSSLGITWTPSVMVNLGFRLDSIERHLGD
jgi:hypothetical protein